MNKRISLKITADLDGKSILSVLRQLRVSDGIITYLKKLPHGITVDGTHATVRRILKEGECLVLDILEEGTGSGLVPTPLPIDIIYEDEDVIVLNKPPFVPTHPSHGHQTDTLANALCYYFKNQDQRNGEFVFRALNRLDRNTSGVVCVTKNKYAAALYGAEMAEGRIKKKYLAVTDGDMSALNDGAYHLISTYIRRERESIITRTVCDPDEDGAASAITEFKVICVSTDKKHSLVELLTQTGRTHQLRVHLSHIGYPITGDGLYGRESADIARHALHAEQLFIEMQGRTRSFIAPLPEDIKALIDNF